MAEIWCKLLNLHLVSTDPNSIYIYIIFKISLCLNYLFKGTIGTSIFKFVMELYMIEIF